MSFNSIKYCLSKTNLLDKLYRRNLLSLTYPNSKECRDQIQEELTKPSTIYAGFDATSDNLHIGNLAILMNLLHFYSAGHQVICLVGDATAQVGDPSGHASDRKRIEKSVINQNCIAIEKSIETIFKNFNSEFCKKLECQQTLAPIFIRNSTWFEDRYVIDFVDDIFRHVRVGSLLHKKSIQERLESNNGMNMSEFCYQIFQAYDWHMLHSKFNCKFQLGGSDQAGNIYSGHDFIKMYDNSRESYGLLMPLLLNTKGKKLGKSMQDSEKIVGLNPSKTSSYSFYQQILRTPDNMVAKFMNLFSFLDVDCINNIVHNNLKRKDDMRYCQKILASEMLLLVHGREGLNEALNLTRINFPESS